MMEKPYSEACARNRGPLLEVLKIAFATCNHVLEVGSGSGQHAVHFAAGLPHLQWQTSELAPLHAGIHAWLADAQLPNLRPPLMLDVAGVWPDVTVDGIFTANTLHIMSWPHVEKFFAGVAKVLTTGGVLAVYGPLNYGGAFTSDSNAQFDQWLKARDPVSGLRDFEALCTLAARAGLALEDDHAMPANNRTLVWRRLSVNAT
jgi:cyclopropane fatty-acyl-phospholipid synthase-like methyltransferase